MISCLNVAWEERLVGSIPWLSKLWLGFILQTQTFPNNMSAAVKKWKKSEKRVKIKYRMFSTLLECLFWPLVCRCPNIYWVAVSSPGGREACSATSWASWYFSGVWRCEQDSPTLTWLTTHRQHLLFIICFYCFV